MQRNVEEMSAGEIKNNNDARGSSDLRKHSRITFNVSSGGFNSSHHRDVWAYQIRLSRCSAL